MAGASADWEGAGFLWLGALACLRGQGSAGFAHTMLEVAWLKHAEGVMLGCTARHPCGRNDGPLGKRHFGRFQRRTRGPWCGRG